MPRRLLHKILIISLSQTLMLSSLAALAESEKHTAKKVASNSEVQAPFKSSIKWRESRLSKESEPLAIREEFPDLNWWEQFNDPILNSYIQDALKANQDLNLAGLKIQESQALARQQLGVELPQVSFPPRLHVKKTHKT